MKFDFKNELSLVKELIEYVDSSVIISVCKHTKDKILNLLNSIYEHINDKDTTVKNDMGNVSDGYHTFNELYHHRAILFSVICNQHPDLAWKSLNHDGPNNPMYDGMFIVGINTPDGQATYHYDIDPYWDIFNIKELDRAPKWDGHTPDVAINRIMSLSNDINNNDIVLDLVNDL